MVLLNTLVNMWISFQNTFSGILSFMSKTLSEVLHTGNSFVDNILNQMLSSLNVSDFSLMEFMLGGGLTLLIVFAITKWVIDILP